VHTAPVNPVRTRAKEKNMTRDNSWSRRDFLKAGLAAGAAAGAAVPGSAAADGRGGHAHGRNELIELTAVEAVWQMRFGGLSAERYARALLDRAAAMASLNAITNLDRDQVLSDAREADRRRRHTSPHQLGPLHGLPLLLKDNINTRAAPTTAATPGLRDHRPRFDAPVAAALFKAGGMLFAKANMHELAFGITSNNPTFGPVRNPYDPTLIPGGSSGGNAAAAAARICPAGLGTDTGGSTRIPPSLCGVCGMRPTAGRYPNADLVPISRTRDTAGPIARSVADLALLDGVITGTPTEVRPARLRGLRLGVPRGHFYEDLDASIVPVIEAALARLRAEGAVLVEADLPGLQAINDQVGFPLALYEVMRDLPNYLADTGAGVTLAQIAPLIRSADVNGLFAALVSGASPPNIPDAVYLNAVNTARFQLQATYRSYFREHAVEAIVFPTTPLPARPIGQDVTVELNGRQVPTFTTYIRNTDPDSNAGIPGVTIPAGLTSAGLPIGIEFDGPSHGDRRVLEIAMAAQRVLPRVPPPAL
jgi:mandelamide amidase